MLKTYLMRQDASIISNRSPKLEKKCDCMEQSQPAFTIPSTLGKWAFPLL